MKLLGDTKIPAQHAKVVRVKIVNPEQLKKISVNMLIPRRNTLLEEGIVVTNLLIHSDPEGCFKIIMENYSLNSVHLSRGQEVGVLELVTLIPLERISSGQDLQLGADGIEESVLYTVQCAAKSGYTH